MSEKIPEPNSLDSMEDAHSEQAAASLYARKLTLRDFTTGKEESLPIQQKSSGAASGKEYGVGRVKRLPKRPIRESRSFRKDLSGYPRQDMPLSFEQGKKNGIEIKRKLGEK